MPSGGKNALIRLQCECLFCCLLLLQGRMCRRHTAVVLLEEEKEFARLNILAERTLMLT
jgi:hypothetical protein